MQSKSERIWKGFWQLADPKIWVASTVPMAVGAAVSYNLRGMFNLYWFIFTLLGIYFIEIGKNAINEVIDYNSGVDRNVTPANRTPFSGGKKTIVDGLLQINEARVIAILTMLAGMVIGLYIVFFHEIRVLYVGIPGFILAMIYSLPPFKLCYRGLGEITVGITFGPLITAGSYLVQSHVFDLPVLIISLSTGILIASVLWINQYPDYHADKKGNKKNWVVRLGRKRGVKVYSTLFIANYVVIIVAAFILKSIFWLLPLLSLPLARQAVHTARKHYDNTPRLIEANKKTVLIYQLTGLSYILAAVLDKVIL